MRGTVQVEGRGLSVQESRATGRSSSARKTGRSPEWGAVEGAHDAQKSHSSHNSPNSHSSYSPLHRPARQLAVYMAPDTSGVGIVQLYRQRLLWEVLAADRPRE